MILTVTADEVKDGGRVRHELFARPYFAVEDPKGIASRAQLTIRAERFPSSGKISLEFLLKPVYAARTAERIEIERQLCKADGFHQVGSHDNKIGIGFWSRIA